jgi:ATP diphosphatase
MDIGAELERLVAVVARLRAPEGCPWDREQDLRSLRPYLAEEAFEVLDEMDRVGAGGPWAPLCEELGDLLFQIVFHTQLAAEQGAFTMADVSRSIAEKLERRHPHVFGEAAARQGAAPADAPQVLADWARLKAEERKRKTGSEGSVLEGVPTGAPALLRAERLTEKASRIGFTWPDLAGVRGKLAEELAELDAAIASGDRDAKEHELGDVLFSLANLARFIQTPAEDALRQAIARFTSRFHHVEGELRAAGVPFGGAPLAQLQAAWQRAKAAEASVPPPRVPPQAGLAALTLPVADLPRQRAFWDRLAPLLGWRPLASPSGEAGYSDGALVLRFVPGGPGGAGAGAPPLALRFTTAAPGPLREALAAAGLAVAEADGGGLVFQDPSGLRCQVGP